MALTLVQEPEEQEVDALSRLEERIQRAVALVLKLREEKEAAQKELTETQQAWEESQAENAKLSEELDALRSERKQVRGRLEKLLDHIDQLGAGA
jgi:chromosome segregation ATPase